MIVVAALMATLIVGVLYLFRNANTLVDNQMRRLIAESGLAEVVDYGSLDVMLDQVSFHQLRIGPGMSAERVIVYYDSGIFFHRSLRRLEVHGAIIRVLVDADGVQIPQMRAIVSQLQREREGEGVPGLSVERFAWKDCAIHLLHAGEEESRYPHLIVEGNGYTNGASMTFEGSAHDRFQRITMRYDGMANLADRTGEVQIEVPPVTFAPVTLQPDHFYPPFRRLISRVSGDIRGEASLAWSRDTLTSGGTLTMEQVSATVGGVDIEGINARFTLNSLFPPSTPPGQVVTIAGIGQPLSLLQSGELRVSLAPEGVLRLEAASWQLGQGGLAVDPADINLKNLDQTRLLLRLDHVPLSDLVVVGSDTFSASGSVTGVVPLRLIDTTLVVEEGRLETDGPGLIAYNVSETYHQAHPQLKLVFALLQNFHYDSLNVAIDTTDENAMTARLNIKGRNPDVEKGKPVDLTVRLSGDLLKSLLFGFKLYRLPETLIEGEQ